MSDCCYDYPNCEYGVRDQENLSSDEYLAKSPTRLSEPSPWSQENDAMLTVVFIDGRTVSVPIMVPNQGEAVEMRDGLVLAENRAARFYTFPNVSHWWTDSI